MIIRSWGNYPQVEHAAVIPLRWRHLPLPRVEGTMLAVGLARSYGDSCLNEGGTLLVATGLDRLIAFDREQGILRCEAGLSLAQILALVSPFGWTLPVVPGTAFVTVGGAIANDVHGKNHHVAGTFGHHVRRLELLRSDGSRLECSLEGESALFRATVGGLGLTGLITWAEIALCRVRSDAFDVETIATGGLQEFLELSDASAAAYGYTVAWVDALASGADIGRGLFMRANHAAVPAAPRRERTVLSVPVNFPAGILNRHTVGFFNALYRSRASAQWKASRQSRRQFLFPLDGIARWNRMYGRAGFLQHQSVVPRVWAADSLREMLAAVALAGEASFLTVLKVFGDHVPAGMMSFARPGVTLALDVALRGESTLRLLDRLDTIVREVGGAIYPAKDARMSPETFRVSFPKWREFATHVDPDFSSSFWRRVTA